MLGEHTVGDPQPWGDPKEPPGEVTLPQFFPVCCSEQSRKTPDRFRDLLGHPSRF